MTPDKAIETIKTAISEVEWEYPMEYAEAFDMAINALEAADLDIPDIEDKIAELETEITKIRETDPYQYKYLLENPDLVATKKAELNEELKSYEDYSNQLDKALEGIMGKGVKITWQMNW